MMSLRQVAVNTFTPDSASAQLVLACRVAPARRPLKQASACSISFSTRSPRISRARPISNNAAGRPRRGRSLGFNGQYPGLRPSTPIDSASAPSVLDQEEGLLPVLGGGLATGLSASPAGSSLSFARAEGGLGVSLLMSLKRTVGSLCWLSFCLCAPCFREQHCNAQATKLQQPTGLQLPIQANWLTAAAFEQGGGQQAGQPRATQESP